MDKTTLQFLELLKSGLWGQPADPTLFSDGIDWTRLYAMAEKQTVIGICMDGIETLPKECITDIDMLMEWVGQTKYIEDANNRLDQGVVEVVSRYNAKGLHPVLLKGQGVGQYYRKPNHRSSGDIDLYFTECIEKANEIAATWDGVEFQEATASHSGFTWKGYVVENHHKYVKFVSHKNKKAWEHLEKTIGLVGTEKYVVSLSGHKPFEVAIPQPQINVLYVFIHLLHHFLQVGVGLRQVCDWLCLWKACESKIDKSLFQQTVNMLPIRRSMVALTWIAENYLGLDSNIIPLNTNTKRAQSDGMLLLNDILETGNFGHDTDIMKGFKRNQHLHNLKSYYLAGKRMMRIHKLCPSELNEYPWHWIKSKVTDN